MKKNHEIEKFLRGLPKNFLRSFLYNDEGRTNEMTLSAGGIRVDFSKQLWDMAIFKKLTADVNIDGAISRKIESLFSGQKINFSEDRAVKHYLLRAMPGDYHDPDEAIAINERERFLSYSEKIYLDPKIKNIVSIGIGGSDLGPRMVHQALPNPNKKLFFVSNIDAKELDDVLTSVNFEETIFVIVSKTFTTAETLHNALRAKSEFIKNHSESDFQRHFIAVTANSNQAVDFGIHPDKIFKFWDWVGGRYSLASSVGISLAMVFGRKTFEELLYGMRVFDQHFVRTPLEKNLAFWHALSWFYNLNYLDCKSVAVVGYSSKLEYLATYLQQLVMESNGKSFDLADKELQLTPSPVIFGEIGTNSQHSFFQMIHQGPDLIPVDFILVKPRNESKEDISLISNALAQSRVLAIGSDESSDLADHKKMSGNRPSNLIILDSLDAINLGALIAFYEASTIIQGFIANINSFDQWGVQLGKSVAGQIQNSIEHQETTGLDSSTKAAIDFIF